VLAGALGAGALAVGATAMTGSDDGARGSGQKRATAAQKRDGSDRIGTTAARGKGGPALEHVAGQADNVYYLVNKHSGKCLTVGGASKAENAAVNQYRCVGAKNQWWVIYGTGGATHRFENYHSGLNLSPAGNSERKGTKLVQRSGDGTNSQLFWASMGLGSNRSPGTISAQHHPGKLCLDVQGAGTADNAPVILWDCNRRGNQSWTAKG
jgi:hypothetical protein